MIQFTSGHLGCGDWKFKEVDHVMVLANVQSFNRHGEFRIGPAQVIAYKIEQSLEDKSNVIIHFTDDMYCRAIISNQDINKLDTMVKGTQVAPEFKQTTQNWVAGAILFFIICTVFSVLP